MARRNEFQSLTNYLIKFNRGNKTMAKFDSKYVMRGIIFKRVDAVYHNNVPYQKLIFQKAGSYVNRDGATVNQLDDGKIGLNKELLEQAQQTPIDAICDVECEVTVRKGYVNLSALRLKVTKLPESTVPGQDAQGQPHGYVPQGNAQQDDPDRAAFEQWKQQQNATQPPQQNTAPPQTQQNQQPPQQTQQPVQQGQGAYDDFDDDLPF